MKKVDHYGRLESTDFEMYPLDIFNLLKKAGEIPEGFALDPDSWDKELWPVWFSVKRFTPEVTDSHSTASSDK